MVQIYSPNMLKQFELCPKKFYFRYIKKLSMPVNDDIFELGKNIHAMASYYLRKDNIDKMEKSLSPQECSVWKYLKDIKYFSYNLVNTEYNLTFKLGDNFFGGRLDALVKNEDTYYILDYKTGTIPRNAQYDYQTIIYMLAVKEFFKAEKVSFIYLDLKNKTEAKFDLSDELIVKYKNILLNIVMKINNSEFLNKQSDCNCEYKMICY